MPIEDLQANDVIVVSAGEQIPADGRVLQGRGLVDERMIRGLEGLSRKQPDDEVFAGSTIRLGELHIEVLRHGSKLGSRQWHDASGGTTAPRGSRTPTQRGETFAEQTVAPTMAIAGLGLLSVTFRQPVPSFVLTMRLVQEWRFHWKLSRPLPYPSVTAS